MTEVSVSATRVLSVGSDSTLLSTREHIISRAGYSVSSLSYWNGDESLELAAFDVVLLCHSVLLDRAQRIIDSARLANPDVVTVRLIHCESIQEAGFDEACPVGTGPGRLLEKLAWISSIRKLAA